MSEIFSEGFMHRGLFLLWAVFQFERDFEANHKFGVHLAEKVIKISRGL